MWNVTGMEITQYYECLLFHKRHLCTFQICPTINEIILAFVANTSPSKPNAVCFLVIIFQQLDYIILVIVELQISLTVARIQLLSM